MVTAATPVIALGLLRNEDSLTRPMVSYFNSARLCCVQFSALASGGILFALFSAPFWFAGYQLAGQAFAGALMHERFAIGRSKWRLAQVGSHGPEAVGGHGGRRVMHAARHRGELVPRCGAGVPAALDVTVHCRSGFQQRA